MAHGWMCKEGYLVYLPSLYNWVANKRLGSHPRCKTDGTLDTHVILRDPAFVRKDTAAVEYYLLLYNDIQFLISSPDRCIHISLNPTPSVFTEYGSIHAIRTLLAGLAAISLLQILRSSTEIENGRIYRRMEVQTLCISLAFIPKNTTHM